MVENTFAVDDLPNEIENSSTGKKHLGFYLGLIPEL